MSARVCERCGSRRLRLEVPPDFEAFEVCRDCRKIQGAPEKEPTDAPDPKDDQREKIGAQEQAEQEWDEAQAVSKEFLDMQDEVARWRDLSRRTSEALVAEQNAHDTLRERLAAVEALVENARPLMVVNHPKDAPLFDPKSYVRADRLRAILDDDHEPLLAEVRAATLEEAAEVGTPGPSVMCRSPKDRDDQWRAYLRAEAQRHREGGQS